MQRHLRGRVASESAIHATMIAVCARALVLECESKSFVFENLNHDFPQRVIYHYSHLETGDSLLARIERMVDRRPESVDFAYRRM